jgi:hypothetical protein
VISGNQDTLFLQKQDVWKYDWEVVKSAMMEMSMVSRLLCHEKRFYKQIRATVLSTYYSAVYEIFMKEDARAVFKKGG